MTWHDERIWEEPTPEFNPEPNDWWPEPVGEEERTYTVQQHGEWSENGAADVDFEAKDMDEVRRIIEKEIPPGTIFVVLDPDGREIQEGTTRRAS